MSVSARLIPVLVLALAVPACAGEPLERPSGEVDNVDTSNFQRQLGKDNPKIRHEPDGRVLVWASGELDDPDAAVDPESEGAHLVEGEPVGAKMGRVVIRRGHMALLPVGAAYRFRAAHASAMIVQTIEGPVTLNRWAEICQQS